MVLHTSTLGIAFELLNIFFFLWVYHISFFFWGSLVPGWYLCLPNDYKIQLSLSLLLFFVCLFPHSTSSARYKYTYFFFSVLKDEFVLFLSWCILCTFSFFFQAYFLAASCSSNKEKKESCLIYCKYIKNVFVVQRKLLYQVHVPYSIFIPEESLVCFYVYMFSLFKVF